MLQDKSMLAQVVVSKWSGSRHDKSVSAAVEAQHNAHNAGRYNKLLIDKAHLERINAAESKIRTCHYKHTLPWTDKGFRLLPSELFMDYRQELSALRDEFNREVSSFVQKYPTLVQEARTRLNTLFDPTDYPEASDLYRRFDVSIEIMPVPDANDFRVSLAEEEKNEIRRQITAAVQERQAAAIKDCWQRVRDVVTRIADQCSKENGRIHDSLMENATDLVGILSKLNITGDPGLVTAESELRRLIVHPDAIRTNPTTRKEVADGASAILAKMPWTS